jgi:hypothetical protein
MAINYDLAKRKGLGKRDIKALETLHKIMTGLATANNRMHAEKPYTKGMRRELRGTVRSLEYQMQAIWGFDQDKSMHYHWARFVCLADHAKAKAWKQSGKMSPPPYPRWETINKD